MEQIQKFFQSETPVRWVFNGDSITQGALHTYGHRDYTELFSERVRFTMGRGSDLVIKSAVSNNTTRHLLETFEHRVAAVRPHVVFYMIGMNDCFPKVGISVDEYERNLDLLGRKTEEIGAVPVFQTHNPLAAPSAEQQALRASLPEYLQAVRNVAKTGNWLLIDHYEFWQQHEAHWFSWMNNFAHPNAYGHIVFYRCLIETLGIVNPPGEQEHFFVPGLSG